MNNIQNEVVKLMQASRNNALCISSSAIDAFARALGWAETPEERESLGQPTIVTLRDERSDWIDLLWALSLSTNRPVVAIDEVWLEDHCNNGHGYDQPMAIVYVMVDDDLCITEAKLHHSRSDKARLCSADLAEEHVHYTDGNWGWERLPKGFTKRAAVGVQRAGERWFWDHDQLATEELVAGICQHEEDERLPTSIRLPGVVLTMGRWSRPSTGARAA